MGEHAKEIVVDAELFQAVGEILSGLNLQEPISWRWLLMFVLAGLPWYVKLPSGIGQARVAIEQAVMLHYECEHEELHADRAYLPYVQVATLDGPFASQTAAA